MTTTNETTNGTTATIMDRALACELSIGRLGVRRKVRNDRIRVTADGPDQQTIGTLTDGESIAAAQPESGMLAVSKRILDCPEYRAIESEDNRIRALVDSRGVPSVMRRGVYLIPDPLVEQVDHMIADYQERRRALVDEFLTVYEHEAAAARDSLGALYDAADYPPASRVRAAFSVRVRWVSFGVAGRMRSVSDAIYRREQTRIRQELEDASREIRTALRVAFADLVDHMAERLQPTPDGRPRVFRDSLVSNLSGFLETFNARNLTGDEELGRLVDQARRMLEGRDAESLRREPLTRAAVASQVAGIKATLDGMIGDRGRRFNFRQETGTSATQGA